MLIDQNTDRIFKRRQVLMWAAHKRTQCHAKFVESSNETSAAEVRKLSE